MLVASAVGVGVLLVVFRREVWWLAAGAAAQLTNAADRRKVTS